MTIAIGFRAMGGIVMCADTKEIYPDTVKIDKGKVLTSTCKTGTYVITGATDDADVLQAATERILEKLQSEEYEIHRTARTVMAEKRGTVLMEDAIKEAMDEIRDKCVLPFPIDQQPWVNVLIGVARRGVTGLFKATPRATAPVRTYDCVGAGILQAKALLDRLHLMGMTRHELEILAIYVMRLVKKYVPDVDGFTDLVGIDNLGRSKWWPAEPILKLETLFAEFDELNRSVISLLCVRPGCTFPSQELANFSDSSEALEKLRGKIWAIAGPLEDNFELPITRRLEPQKSTDQRDHVAQRIDKQVGNPPAINHKDKLTK